MSATVEKFLLQSFRSPEGENRDGRGGKGYVIKAMDENGDKFRDGVPTELKELVDDPFLSLIYQELSGSRHPHYRDFFQSPRGIKGN